MLGSFGFLFLRESGGRAGNESLPETHAMR